MVNDLDLKDNLLLTKQTRGDIIRFAPPLTITETQMHAVCDEIERVILSYKLLNQKSLVLF